MWRNPSVAGYSAGTHLAVAAAKFERPRRCLRDTNRWCRGRSTPPQWACAVRAAGDYRGMREWLRDFEDLAVALWRTAKDEVRWHARTVRTWWVECDRYREPKREKPAYLMSDEEIDRLEGP